MKTFAKMLLVLGGCLIGLSACIWIYSLYTPESFTRNMESAAGSSAGITLVLGIAIFVGGLVAQSELTSVKLESILNFASRLLLSKKHTNTKEVDHREECFTSDARELSIEEASRLANRYQCVQFVHLDDISAEALLELLDCRRLVFPELRRFPKVPEDTFAGLPIELSVGLTTLSESNARIFGRAQAISLPYLQTISDHAFIALLGCKFISLDRLECVSPEAESAIIKSDVRLSLSELTCISDAIAKRLAKNGSVSLNRLTEISDTAMVSLSKCGELSLNGIGQISKVAEDLICSSPVRISLEGLTSITEALAKKLSLTPSLSLNHIVEISDDALMPLLRCKRLSMNGVRQLSKTAEEAILRSETEVSMSGLQSLSPALVAKLCSDKQKQQGDLWLAVRELGDEEARTLSRFRGFLYLPKLESLTRSPGHIELSTKLGQQNCFDQWASEESLDLNGIRTLSAEAAKEIAAYSSDIQLNGLPSLSAETARALATHEAWRLYLNGVEELSDEAAAEISKFKGEELHMRGLTRLTLHDGHAALVSRLLSQDNDTYDLNKLLEISEDVAQAIVRSTKDSFVNLLGLTTLPVQVAKVLCGSNLDLYLHSVEFISDDVAEHLRDYKHRVELLGLKSLSTRAASLLRSNPECVIPDQFEADNNASL